MEFNTYIQYIYTAHVYLQNETVSNVSINKELIISKPLQYFISAVAGKGLKGILSCKMSPWAT